MLAAPIPENEAQRMDALRSLNVLFTPAEERFDRITRLAIKIFGTPIATVTLIADQEQWFKSAQGLDGSGGPRDTSFCGHAVMDDATFVVENAIEDPRFADNPLVLGDPNIRFYAGHPLRTMDGSRVGTLCVIDREPRQFSEDQLDTLRDLAALVETELGRTHLTESHRALLKEREELQRKAMIDGLTRLWNRSAIVDLLSKELERAKRGGDPVCVAMVDADRFKAINDTYGHQSGDATLVALATRLRQAVREFDVVGRYGGEEFMVVLSNCDLEAARVVAERIRRYVADDPIVGPRGVLRCTASIGLAQYQPNHKNAADLIAMADAALYRAKATGRNRVES